MDDAIKQRIRSAVAEPVDKFFFQDVDPVAYIDEKISNINSILAEWPDMESDAKTAIDANQPNASQSACNALSFLSQKSEEDVLAVMTDTQVLFVTAISADVFVFVRLSNMRTSVAACLYTIARNTSCRTQLRTTFLPCPFVSFLGNSTASAIPGSW